MSCEFSTASSPVFTSEKGREDWLESSRMLLFISSNFLESRLILNWVLVSNGVSILLVDIVYFKAAFEFVSDVVASF